MKEDPRKTVWRTVDASQIITEKTDPRIEYRGKLDLALANVFMANYYVRQLGDTSLIQGMQDIGKVLLELQWCDAIGRVPVVMTFGDVPLETIQPTGWCVLSDIVANSYEAAWLNLVRTHIRELERTFWTIADDSEYSQRVGLILNRLSTAAYNLILRIDEVKQAKEEHESAQSK